MKTEKIQRITVIGTGVMGPDICLGFAMAGYEVTGLDLEQEILDRAARKIASNCRQLVEGELLSNAEAGEVQTRISLTLDWDRAVAGADYIMEAVPEEMATKQEVFRRCGELCPAEVVVASNTSSMSITEIASSMKHPQRAIGTHWTIPAHLSPMVEVIRGENTSDDTEELALELLKKIGKYPVRCKNSPGFIHNYVQFAMVKAALDLLEKGVATAEDIDSAVRNGFGLRLSSVGPIQFVDLCGLDTILNVQNYMYEISKESLYKPIEIIKDKVDQGALGLKTGKGFYEYSDRQSGSFLESTQRNIIKILRALRES
jgi:3-hydroxybutyryl-CoA dehydrogenase